MVLPPSCAHAHTPTHTNRPKGGRRRLLSLLPSDRGWVYTTTPVHRHAQAHARNQGDAISAAGSTTSTTTLQYTQPARLYHMQAITEAGQYTQPARLYHMQAIMEASQHLLCPRPPCSGSHLTQAIVIVVCGAPAPPMPLLYSQTTRSKAVLCQGPPLCVHPRPYASQAHAFVTRSCPTQKTTPVEASTTTTSLTKITTLPPPLLRPPSAGGQKQHRPRPPPLHVCHRGWRRWVQRILYLDNFSCRGTAERTWRYPNQHIKEVPIPQKRHNHRYKEASAL